MFNRLGNILIFMFYLIINYGVGFFFCLLIKMCYYVVNDNSDDKLMKYGDGRKILMRNSVNYFLFEFF